MRNQILASQINSSNPQIKLSVIYPYSFSKSQLQQDNACNE
uniref:Uncharacterized protein n=1 Tax=Arundo donax TaxID=35708 RepID=A0A0A9FR36_ARUDO